jgi:hypothetical protein
VLRRCGDERGWAKVKTELELSVKKELSMSHDPSKGMTEIKGSFFPGLPSSPTPTFVLHHRPLRALVPHNFTLSLQDMSFRLVEASISLTLPMTTTVRLLTQRCFRRYPAAPLAERENRPQTVPLALADRLTVCVSMPLIDDKTNVGLF